MSSIRTVINVQDRMTPAFTSMNRALNIVISSFEELQKDSKKAVDTSSIKQAREELSRAELAINNVENGIRQANLQQQGFNKKLREGQVESSGLMSKIKGIVGAYAGMQAIRGVVDLSDQMSQTESKLSMILDKYTSINEMQNMIYQAAQNSKSSYQGTADVIARIGNNAKGVFSSNAELVKFAEVLNKKYIIAGASSEEMNNSIIQLTQGLGSGVLRGEELNSVFESAPNIIQSIADYLGVPIGKIRSMAAEGKLTAETVKNAILSSANETDKQFNGMSTTWAQRWTTIKNAGLMAFNGVLKKINEIANTPAFDNLINGAINAMNVFGTIVSNGIDVLFTGLSYLQKAFETLSPVIMGAASVVAIYYTSLGIMKGIEIASATVKGIYTTAQALSNIHSWAGVKALIALKAAQMGLNTAILASPIFWIPALIIGIIALLTGVITIINKVCGTSISVIGVIIGAVYALGAIIANIAIFVYNAVVMVVTGIANACLIVGAAIAAAWDYVWKFVANLAIGAAEWVVNKWNEAVYNVTTFFANLGIAGNKMAKGIAENAGAAASNIANAFIKGANKAIDGINWIIDALNKIPGVDISKATKFGEVNWKPDTSGFDENIKDFQNMIDKGPTKVKFDRFEYDGFKMPNLLNPDDASLDYMDIGDAYNNGYKQGEEWQNGMGDWFSNLFGDNQNKMDNEKNFKGVENNTKKAADSGKKTAGNTAKMAKTMDASNEDLKYLRDIAEREVINRFTTAEIKVEMNNNNQINSDMDIDGIVTKLTDKLEEELISTAEGIHK